MKCPCCLLGALVLWIIPLHAQTNPYQSGGTLTPEQAAYDVLFYDLTLEVTPDLERIQGSLQMDARIVHPTDCLVLDLFTCANRSCPG